MRQRYYNPEIKRFINQDVITGSISNSQSLNRYSYVQGNPISYTDPFGLSPLSGLFTWNGLAHCLLGLLGNVPFLGVLANLVDAGIYLFVDHDYFMAGVSGVAAITMGASCVASWAAKSKTLANGVKVARNAKLAKTAQYMATVGDLVSDGLNFADNAANLGMTAGIMLGKYVFGGQEFDEGTKYEALGLGMALMGFVTSGGSMLRNGSKLDGMLQADGFYDSLKRLKMDNRGSVDLGYFKGGTKADTLAQNRIQGKAYEQQEFANFSSQNSNAVEQITIKTESGVRTRVDAIGIDSNGNVVINEFKSSTTAPLTNNQKIAFPEIMESGGVVVGKGKGIFKGGYQIPAGTQVKIIRPQ